MTDVEIARPLEQELQKLFGEDSCQLERRSCTGKYRGHTDYTLVFGSGRRLYIGLDQRNYLNSLHDHLRAIRYFRTHQEENSRRINAVLAAHDTPFCCGEVEIMPYDNTNDLTLYAVVILSTRCGVRFVYRTTNMHGCLVGYKAPCFDFDSCMAHLLQDACGSKLCKIVDVCQRLAGLETRALIDYIHRGSLEIKDPGADEEGICPICGGELEYGNDEPLDDGGAYEWTCPSCGATGKEGYDKVFDQHYEVYDGDGNPYPAPPQ